jgi:hypothetical protein
VWLADAPAPDDPLRQGDLVLDVVFPTLKLPLPFYKVQQQQQHQTTTPAVESAGLVVSQCCDNTGNDYAAIAPVSIMRGSTLKDHQLVALLADEPTWNSDKLIDYDVEHFKLDDLDGFAAPDGKYHVANLNRAASFYGNCQELVDRRRARMTVLARRLLRIKLGYLWGRVEDTDLAWLRAAGVPPGPTPR